MNKSYIVKNNDKETRVYDLNLLKTVLSVQSTSDTKLKGGDARILELIHSVLKSIALNTGVTMNVTEDAYGNIYVKKGEAKSFPCVVAHTDTVHSIVDRYRVYQQNDILFAFSDATKTQVGIGGDDKVGVFTVLQALLDIPNIKAVFFRNEEIGRLGSKHSITFNKSFYKDCSFILQCDRKGNTDFITKSAGVKMTEPNFEKAVRPYVKKHGFDFCEAGIATDVDVLVREGVGICAVNISSGYYAPHTSSETVSVANIGRAYAVVYDICTELGNTRFPYKYVPTVYSYHKPATIYRTGPKKNDEDKYKLYCDYEEEETKLNDSKYDHFVREACDDNFKVLPGCVDIIYPRKLYTDYRCKTLGCGKPLVVDTTVNTLHCSDPACRGMVETMYVNWPEKYEAKLKIKGEEKSFVYSWLHRVWIEKSNAVFITQNQLDAWTSKQLYERDWKK